MIHNVCVLISYGFCSLISASKKLNIETMLAFPYSYNWQKLTTTNRVYPLRKGKFVTKIFFSANVE